MAERRALDVQHVVEPQMPQGVEHLSVEQACRQRCEVVEPQMPQGVEHGNRCAHVAVVPCGRTSDAARR